MRNSLRGFTLIELMIVVTIIAILAMIALPSYESYIRKSRRADAHALLQAAQLAQEKYRLAQPVYWGAAGTGTENFSSAVAAEEAALVVAFGRVCSSSRNPCRSQAGYYKLRAITPVGGGTAGTSYQLSAIALAPQTSDVAACQTITVTQTPTEVRYEPTECWKK